MQESVCLEGPNPSACQSSQILSNLSCPASSQGSLGNETLCFLFEFAHFPSFYQKPDLFLFGGKCIWLLSEFRCLGTCWQLGRQRPLPVQQLLRQNVLGMCLCFSRCLGTGILPPAYSPRKTPTCWCEQTVIGGSQRCWAHRGPELSRGGMISTRAHSL